MNQYGTPIKKKKKDFFSLENIKEIVGILLVVFLVRTFGFGLYQVPSGSMETTMLVGDRFFADKFTYNFTSPKHGDILSFNDPTYPYSENSVKRLFENYVWGPSNWTKRVIGVPGDVVEGRIEDGKPVVYRNGEKLDEPYLNKYPLIGVWKTDPSGLFQHMQGKSEDWIMRQWTFYSYDPNVSYEDQPFYRISPNKVVIGNDGRPITLWPGSLIREPEAARPEGNFFNGTDEFYWQLGPDEYWCMGDNRLGSKDCRCFGPIKRSLIHGKIVLMIWSLDSDESFFLLDLIKHPIDFWTRVRWNRTLKFVH